MTSTEKISLNKIRGSILEMLFLAGSGHPGSSLSIVEILYVLCFEEINWQDKFRNKLILSKGHGAPCLYALFYELNLISQTELKTFRTHNSQLQGHPDRRKLEFIDAGTGALGQGLSISIGFALGFNLRNIERNVFCIVGDGELQEGQIWEAAMFASARELQNLCVFVDFNKMQNEREIVNTLSLGDLKSKWESFGWNVIEIDGHNKNEIRKAINDFKKTRTKPTVILANTVKGKGISFMENSAEWHGKKIDQNNFELAMKELQNEGT